MKKDTKNPFTSILIVCIAISLLIISGSMAYYFVIYIPKRDADKTRYTQEQIIQKQKAEDDAKISANAEYLKCLSTAKENNHKNWINACKLKGIPVVKDSNGDDNCLLPNTSGDRIKADYDKTVKVCENLYLK